MAISRVYVSLPACDSRSSPHPAHDVSTLVQINDITDQFDYDRDTISLTSPLSYPPLPLAPHGGAKLCKK